jgi:hypothetical protein
MLFNQRTPLACAIEVIRNVRMVPMDVVKIGLQVVPAALERRGSEGPPHYYCPGRRKGDK